MRLDPPLLGEYGRMLRLSAAPPPLHSRSPADPTAGRIQNSDEGRLALEIIEIVTNYTLFKDKLDSHIYCYTFIVHTHFV